MPWQWVKVNIEPQLILFWFKPDENTNGTFVDFIIVIDPSYTEARLKNVNNNLGKDEKNSGIDFSGVLIHGETIISS